MSIKTSVKQVPALFRKVDMPDGSLVFNYGCGRFPDMVEEAFPNVYFIHFDPYFDRHEKNEAYVHHKVLDAFFWFGSEVGATKPESVLVMCANVLNVIPDGEEFDEVVQDLEILANEGHPVHLSVYEGDKSGVGKKTIRGYQRNQKAAEYMSLFPTLDVKRKGNVLTLTKRG